MDKDYYLIVVCFLIITFLSYKYRHPGVCEIDPTLERLRRDLIKLDARAANLQYFPSDESYTEDKEKIFLCMRDKQGNYYSYNDLLQVAIHELSHALCPVIDFKHVTPEFNGIHQSLLKKAADKGMINIHKPVVSDYCLKD